MRIVAYNLPERLTYRLSQVFGNDIKVRQQKLTEKAADPAADIAILTITSPVSAKALSKMPKLRAILTASTGTDHIDMDECEKRGIKVMNCPSYSANGVAELAVALAFAGLRDLEKMLGFGKSLAYPPFCFYHIGSELAGKKCAVLGTGQIGSLIAKKLLALGCDVVAFSRSQNPELVKAGVAYASLEDAARNADIVFVALPSSPQTFHVVSDKFLSLMRDGSGIVNIARGELVDSEALLKHIDRLAFYAADVVEGEAALWLGRPMKVEAVNELVRKQNFLLAPHIGASTKEAQERLAAEVVSAVSELKSAMAAR
jgi:D-3-phosphoglycerate dehydrogenase